MENNGGKKNKKNKPKQPQRGLGVAQLEKIRLHSQLATGYPPNSLLSTYHPTFNHQGDIATYSSIPTSSSSFSYPTSSVVPSYGFQPSMVNRGHGEYERCIKYPPSSSSITSWNGAFQPQYFPQPNMTLQFLNQEFEESSQTRDKKHRDDLIGNSQDDSNSDDTEEIDLELKL